MLRMALVLSALATFAAARLGVALPEGVFLGLAFPGWITREMVAGALAALTLYLALHFYLRTRVEKAHVFSRSAKLGRAIHRLDTVRAGTESLLASFGGALLSERLKVWDDAVAVLTLSPTDSELKALAALGAQASLFDAAAERVEFVLDEIALLRRTPSEEGPDPAGRQRMWEEEARRLLDLLRRMEDVGLLLDNRSKIMRTAVTETRDALKDARYFFSNERQNGPEDLPRHLRAALGELEEIRGALAEGRRAFGFERMLLSVQVPLYGSLALLLLSAEARIRQTIGGLGELF